MHARLREGCASDTVGFDSKSGPLSVRKGDGGLLALDFPTDVS